MSDSTYIGRDDFVSLVKDGITINFHIKNPAIEILHLFRSVKRAQKVVEDKFDRTLKKIDISIYSSMQEMRQEGRSRSRYASWIAGIFDGEIRVICENEDEDAESLYTVLTHEIIHLAVDAISGGKCADWLNEGLAICLSQRVDGYYKDVLDKAVKSGKTWPIEALKMSLFSYPDNKIRSLAYAQAASLTEYLVETYGWGRVAGMVGQCRERPVEKVLDDMGLNYTLMEMGWELWARRQAD